MSSSSEKKRAVIRIENPEDLFNSVYLPLILEKKETQRPLLVIEGGRGSAKSREIAHAIVIRSLKRKMRIALVRKVEQTIRQSQYQEIQNAVTEWGLTSEFDFKVSPLEIRNSAGTVFICKGLDKSTKIKSMANIDLVWIEEAEELTKDDWTDLSLTVRGKSKNVELKQIILSFNRKAGNWTEEEFFHANGEFKNNPDIYHLHTTYLDNRFLDQAFLNRLARMKEEDYELWQKNALGLPIALKGLIYTNWRLCDEFPECSEVIYGLDFGFNDPMVLTKVGRRGDEIYLETKFYDSSHTTGDLIKLLPRLVHSRSAEIYCDTAEPDRIEEIYRAGYNAHESEKDVNAGIDVCKRFKLFIVRTSTQAIKDIENYKWAEDRTGKSLDKPVHAYSHFPDSFRYAIYTHWGKDFLKVTTEQMKQIAFAPMHSESLLAGYL